MQAEASRDKLGGNIATGILPIKNFTYAEDYHQKYYLTRYSDIREFLTKTYRSEKALADSTAATRLNAYLGSGMQRNWQSFLAELASYGLPENIEQSLRKTCGL
jgi:peptide-methionine (S)-S-oxide reductase